MRQIIKDGKETVGRKLKENEERIVTEAEGKIDFQEDVINQAKSVKT